jgi:hypothetical protein
MTLSNEMLKFALSHARTPQEAARLAELLGRDMVNSTPAVCFPAQWVKEHFRGDPDIACCAISNCNDPETLTFIAEREKRVHPRHALANNKFLTNEARAILLSKITGHSSNAEVLRSTLQPPEPPAPKLSRAQELSSVLSEIVTDQNFYSDKLAKALAHVSKPKAQAAIEQLVRDTVAVGYTEVLYEYIAACYHADIACTEVLAMARKTFSVTEALSLVDDQLCQSTLTTVLTEAISRRHASHYASQGVLPFDLEITKLFLEYLDPKEVEFDYTEDLFTEEATDLLCGHPNWATSFLGTDLTDHQFTTLWQAGAPEEDMLGHVNGPERLRLVMDSRPDTFHFDDEFDLYTALELIDRNHQDLIARLVELAEPNEVIDYVLWFWDHRYNRAGVLPLMAPSLNDIPDLLAKIGPDALDGTNVSLQYIKDDAYVRALVDQVPGLAFSYRDDALVGTYVFERLLATGLDLELSLEQFERGRSTRSLNEVCALLGALHLATAN